MLTSPFPKIFAEHTSWLTHKGEIEGDLCEFTVCALIQYKDTILPA